MHSAVHQRFAALHACSFARQVSQCKDSVTSSRQMTHAGVVSEAGRCCAANPSANATLDRAGQCCSEALDACGVCGGDGLTMDFTGVCCDGAIDASGLCCASPNVVDDFGVCGGNSSTGSIVLDLDVLSSSVAGAIFKPHHC